MSLPPSTTSTRPTDVTSHSGLPAAAQEVLHRELLHLHSSLHLILMILRGPFDSVTPSVVDTITCPRISANLRALENCLEQIRTTCTTLIYADDLCSALAIPRSTGRSTPTTPPPSRPTLFVLQSPPPGTTTGTTTTAPISANPTISPPTLVFSASPTTLLRLPRSSSSPSRSRSPPRRFRF